MGKEKSNRKKNNNLYSLKLFEGFKFNTMIQSYKKMLNVIRRGSILCNTFDIILYSLRSILNTVKHNKINHVIIT